MNIQHDRLAATAAALVVPALAQAHGSSAEGSTLHHYLSSPDHVIAFCLLGLIALVIATRLLRKSAVTARLKKR
jgi:hypothetical protein